MDPRLAALLTWDYPSPNRRAKHDFPKAKPLPSNGSATTSGIWCWHCCHPFEGKGVPLPIAYDERRDTWKTKGIFCSFACAKGYNTDDGGVHSSIVGQLLALLHKRMSGTFSSIVPAPPRRTLKIFGGTLSIEEFRAKSKMGIIIHDLPPRMVPLETILADRKACTRRTRPRQAEDLTETIDFADVSASRNETLRLRRPRPMPSDTNVLARTMGLTLG